MLSQKKRSDCESQKSRFGFDLKNPLECRFYGFMIRFGFTTQKTQDPFLDSDNRIWISPQKMHPCFTCTTNGKPQIQVENFS